MKRLVALSSVALAVSALGISAPTDRATVKAYFETGDRPSQAHFETSWDSVAFLQESDTVTADWTFADSLLFSGSDKAGLRLKSLTTAQRGAIASPAAGDTIWNTTTSQGEVYNGSAWEALGGAGSSGWGDLTGSPSDSGDVSAIGESVLGSADASALRDAIGLGSASSPAFTAVNLAGATVGSNGSDPNNGIALTPEGSGGVAVASGDLTVSGGQVLAKNSVTASSPSFANASDTDTGWTLSSSGPRQLWTIGSDFEMRLQNAELALNDNLVLGWAGSDMGAHTAIDTTMSRGSAGVIDVTSMLSLPEVGSAPAGVANRAIVFAEDNGSGKTRLMVQFGTGAAQQLAIEP